MKHLRGILIALAVLAVVAFAWWVLHERGIRTKAEATADSLLATSADAWLQRTEAIEERDQAKQERDQAMTAADQAAGQRGWLLKELGLSKAVTDSLAAEMERQEAGGEKPAGLTWRGLYQRRTGELRKSEAVLGNALGEISDLRRADSASQRALRADSLQMGRDSIRIAALEESLEDLRKPGLRLFGIPLPSLSIGYGATVARDSLMKGKIHAVDGVTVNLGYTIHF